MTDDANTDASSGSDDQVRPNASNLEVLKAKYKQERDERAGINRAPAPQLVGDLAKYLDDPHTAPSPREPVFDEVDVTIIGAGFGGLLVGTQLRQGGVEKIRYVDKSGGVGGTWYWNRYPGARCDIEAYIYMPLLEEMGYVPTERYVTGREILTHAQNIAEKYRLTDHALFQTSVTEATWLDDQNTWEIETDRGDVFHSRFLVGAIGFLSNPKLAAIPGVESFEGDSFHTSRWDYSVTGENLEKLANKRVAVVGTGSSAIQVIPFLGRAAQQLYVFQRTPAAVGVRDNRPTDPEWGKDFSPGWQKDRMENFTALTMGEGADVDMVGDGFSIVFQGALYRPRDEAIASGLPPEKIKEAIDLADAELMDGVRQRVASIVRDEATAEALKPYFYYLCKRPCFHDEYLDTFNLPNVTLVNSPRGVEEIRGSSVVADGKEYDVDVLIYSTGFETSWENGPSFCSRGGFEIYGVDGLSLTEKWSSGTSTFQGVVTSGFPNFFIMPSGVATSVRTPNHMHTLTENAKHIGYVINELYAEGAEAFDVDPMREMEWVEYVVGQSTDGRAFWEACTPGRFNGEGEIVTLRRQDTSFVEKPNAHFRALAEWREQGKLDGLVVKK